MPLIGRDKPQIGLLKVGLIGVTGFVLACMLSHFSHIQLFCDPMDCSPPGSSVHGIDSPGKNTGLGCHGD